MEGPAADCLQRTLLRRSRFQQRLGLALDGTGMELSMSTKDWLEIVVIPIILVLIALVWPLIQNWHRCRRFKKLIFRELHEIGPYPSESERDHWAEHLAKNFAHRTRLREVSPNRDFVLSLNPDLVYCLLQLCKSFCRLYGSLALLCRNLGLRYLKAYFGRPGKTGGWDGSDR